MPILKLWTNNVVKIGLIRLIPAQERKNANKGADNMMYNAKELRDRKENALRKRLGLYTLGHPVPPCLAIIQVGNVPESNKYVGNKLKALERVGMAYRHIHVSENVTTQDLLDMIDGLNKDKNVHGVMVQLPLPKHIETRLVLDAIDPIKDVDGLSSASLSALALGLSNYECTHMPCTVAGVLEILHDMGHEDFKGKNVVVLGKGITSGLPLTHYLIMRGANVVNLASKCTEEDRYKYIQNADIIVSCVGVPHLIDVRKVPLNCTLVNVGMSVNEEGKLVGDYDHILADELGINCTSVVNCSGIMTVHQLLENVMNAFSDQI